MAKKSVPTRDVLLVLVVLQLLVESQKRMTPRRKGPQRPWDKLEVQAQDDLDRNKRMVDSGETYRQRYEQVGPSLTPHKEIVRSDADKQCLRILRSLSIRNGHIPSLIVFNGPASKHGVRFKLSCICRKLRRVNGDSDFLKTAWDHHLEVHRRG